MNDYFEDIFDKYRNSGAVVDSNLLLLFLIGNCDVERIARFKRTKKYTREDYELISNFFHFFKKIYTTPNILTEVSNFLNQLPNELHNSYYSSFSNSIDKYTEKHNPSAEIAKNKCFIKFGLTDTSILESAKGENALVITDDFPLSNYLQSEGIDSINYNHIRGMLWRL